MTRMLTTAVVSATVIVTALGAGPAAGSDWFGVEISNQGLSVGFGSSNWALWSSSWYGGGWSTDFSTALSGYGEWVWVDGLGRVWRPWVAAGWRPFTYGRWVWTTMGWTWVAYEPWGWAPHHYGEWAFTTVGWVWSPGYTYYPGNVIWVGAGDYVGWYPCAPRGWSHAQRGFNDGWDRGYRRGHHDGYDRGYADGWRDARYATWVRWSQVGADNVSSFAVEYDQAARGVARIGVEGMQAPPSRAEVERRGGRQVPEARIVERRATIDGHEVNVVRPEGQAADVQRYADDTVRRALAPAAQDRVTAVASRKTAAGSRSVVASPSTRKESTAPTYRSTAAPRSSEARPDRALRTPLSEGGSSPTPARTTEASTKREVVRHTDQVARPSATRPPAVDSPVAPGRTRPSTVPRRESAAAQARSPSVQPSTAATPTSTAPTAGTRSSPRPSADQPTTSAGGDQENAGQKRSARPVRRSTTRVNG